MSNPNKLLNQPVKKHNRTKLTSDLTVTLDTLRALEMCSIDGYGIRHVPYIDDDGVRHSTWEFYYHLPVSDEKE